MIIKKVTLFNTDLDIDNNNVIDIVNIGNLGFLDFDNWFAKTFLPNLYQSFEIEIIGNKGVSLDTNKNCTLTLNKKLIDNNILTKLQFNQSNYIILECNDNTFYYGFINNIMENGDTYYILNIKYDVWNNNLKHIVFNMHKETSVITQLRDNYFMSEQSHLLEYFDNGVRIEPIYYPLQLTTGKKKYKTHSIIKTHEVDGFDGDLLCMKIICSEQPQIVWKEDSREYAYQLKKSSIGSLNTYYIPIALKDLDNKFKKIRLLGYNCSDTEGENEIPFVRQGYDFVNGYPNLKYDYFEKISNYIISCELTYNYPFDITVEETSTDLYTVTFDDNYVKVVFINEIKHSKDNTVGIGCPVLVPIRKQNDVNVKEVTFDLYDTGIFKSSLQSSNRINFSNGIFKTYPFNTFKLVNNSINQTIEPINFGTQHKLHFRFNSDTVGVLNTYLIGNDTIKDSDEYTFLTNIQETSFSKDSLEYYKLTKGAIADTALQGQLFNSSLHAIGSYFSGNYVGMIGSIGNIGQSIIQHSNNKMSADRTVNSYTKPLQRGEISLDYSDQIRIVNDVIVENDINNLRLNDEIFLKGYNYMIRKNLFGYNKYYFDYNQGNDIVITLNIQNLDKELLKELYIRGFTRNHYRYNEDITKLETRLPTNKDVNNVDYFILEGV